MNNSISEAPFPATRHDLANLKKTASDAAKDIASTAGVHVEKVKGNLQDLATHAQTESRDQLDQAKLRFADLGSTLRDYAAERPLACIGVALAIGFLFGLSRRSS